MAITATLSRTWIKRQLIIGTVACAVSAWFFFDGAVTYPRSNERFHAYMKFVTAGNEDAWPAYAKSQNWNEKPPEKEYRIMDQWVLGTASLLGGLAAFGMLAGSWKRKVSSDDEAVTGTDGTRVAISAIQSTDRRKWQSKGIAYALYESGGKLRRLTIDDFKYEGAEQILLQVEQHIAARKIPTGESPASGQD